VDGLIANPGHEFRHQAVGDGGVKTPVVEIVRHDHHDIWASVLGPRCPLLGAGAVNQSDGEENNSKMN
jgi:hypothetical protein